VRSDPGVSTTELLARIIRTAPFDWAPKQISRPQHLRST
jgi:hypothetical protein